MYAIHELIMSVACSARAFALRSPFASRVWRILHLSDVASSFFFARFASRDAFRCARSAPLRACRARIFMPLRALASRGASLFAVWKACARANGTRTLASLIVIACGAGMHSANKPFMAVGQPNSCGRALVAGRRDKHGAGRSFNSIARVLPRRVAVTRNGRTARWA